MRSATQLKSLGDVKTIISTHARSTPRLQGSTYLEVYLLNIEGRRLQTELSMLAKRQHRIETRLQEIQEATGTLLDHGQQEHNPEAGPTPPAPELERPTLDNAFPPHRWRRMTVEY